jgi:hypothetical protein
MLAVAVYALVSASAVAADDLRLAWIEEALKSQHLWKAMAERAPLWRCSYDSRYSCDASGCRAFEGDGWSLIDFPQETYSRCDSKGCDAYPMTWATAGIFTSGTFGPGAGAFFRTVNNGSSYIEVMTMGVSSVNNFGQCFPR